MPYEATLNMTNIACSTRQDEVLSRVGFAMLRARRTSILVSLSHCGKLHQGKAGCPNVQHSVVLWLSGLTAQPSCPQGSLFRQPSQVDNSSLPSHLCLKATGSSAHLWPLLQAKVLMAVLVAWH